MSLITVDQIISICERQGFAFEASINFDLPTATPRVTFFKTGDKPVILYARRVSFDGDGVDAYIYRNAEFTGGGAAESYSVNDLIQEDAQSVITGGATEVSAGVLTRAPVYIFGNTSNQSQGAVLQAIDSPQIMPPNTVYRLVLDGRAGTQSVASHLSWCEPSRVAGLVFKDGVWEYIGEELLS